MRPSVRTKLVTPRKSVRVQVAANAAANQRKVRVLEKAGRNWETIPHQADQRRMLFFGIPVDIVAYICYPIEHQPHHHGNHNIKTSETD